MELKHIQWLEKLLQPFLFRYNQLYFAGLGGIKIVENSSVTGLNNKLLAPFFSLMWVNEDEYLIDSNKIQIQQSRLASFLAKNGTTKDLDKINQLLNDYRSHIKQKLETNQMYTIANIGTIHSVSNLFYVIEERNLFPIFPTIQNQILPSQTIETPITNTITTQQKHVQSVQTSQKNKKVRHKRHIRKQSHFPITGPKPTSTQSPKKQANNIHRRKSGLLKKDTKKRILYLPNHYPPMFITYLIIWIFVILMVILSIYIYTKPIGKNVISSLY